MWSDPEAGPDRRPDAVILASLSPQRASGQSPGRLIPASPSDADGFDQTRLLWIDEKSPSDPDVLFLEREGFHVDCTTTGSSGLAMARTARYHGILLDLRLPDLPGLAVLATLSAELSSVAHLLEELPRVQLVAVTVG